MRVQRRPYEKWVDEVRIKAQNERNGTRMNPNEDQLLSLSAIRLRLVISRVIVVKNPCCLPR